MKKLLIVLCPFVFTGCAYLSSHTVTPVPYTLGTNVVYVRATTDARAVTFFDSQNQLTKFRNSNGGPTNTYTAGTVASGVNESSSASNVVAIINAAAGAAANAAK